MRHFIALVTVFCYILKHFNSSFFVISAFLGLAQISSHGFMIELSKSHYFGSSSWIYWLTPRASLNSLYSHFRCTSYHQLFAFFNVCFLRGDFRYGSLRGNGHLFHDLFRFLAHVTSLNAALYLFVGIFYGHVLEFAYLAPPFTFFGLNSSPYLNSMAWDCYPILLIRWLLLLWNG